MARSKNGGKNSKSKVNTPKYTSGGAKRQAELSAEQIGPRSDPASPAIQFIKDITNILKPYELSKTERLKTFQAMMLDDSVASAYDAGCVMVEESFSKARVVYNQQSQESKHAAEFIEWNLRNLDKQSLRSFARSAVEMKRDGLAPFTKVFAEGHDEWSFTPSGKPLWKLSRLNYIHPLTLDQTQPFEVTNGGRNIKNMRQMVASLRNSGEREHFGKKYKGGIIKIPRRKITLVTYGATDAEPFGRSPFEAAYTAWREKVFLQDATLTGVAKDFAGTPVLYIPGDILAAASADPNSKDGLMVAQLQRALSAMHTGDQTQMIMPSDTINEVGGSGHRQFEIKFLGVEGSGKQWDTVELVEQRKKAIYNVFGAANLIAADSTGGGNQLDGQTSIHEKFISRDCSVIEEAWNMDIIPQLLRLNEWKLTSEDMPRVVSGDVSRVSLDEYGKYLQRVSAVGLLPKTVEVVNQVMRIADIDYQLPLDMDKDKLFDLLTGSPTEGAGAGMSSGLNGGTGSNTGQKGNASDVNTQNKA